MKTEVIHYPDIIEAVEALKKGIPIVFPTETVYGLGAPVFCEEAIKNVFTIKGRPADNPVIAHIADISDASRLAAELPDSFYALAKAFWPGPLTMVVTKQSSIPHIVSAGHPTIAIRMPSHPVALGLIRAVGEPLAAPSANLSGRPSPTSVRDVLEDLEGKVPFVIEGGTCEIGIESTVVSLIGSVPTILRPGRITAAMIEKVLGQKVTVADAKSSIVSPGMKYRHYAPRAKVQLLFQKENGCVQITQESLYSQLREADRLGLKEIRIYCDEMVQRDAALMNRLLHASK